MRRDLIRFCVSPAAAPSALAADRTLVGAIVVITIGWITTGCAASSAALAEQGRFFEACRASYSESENEREVFVKTIRAKLEAAKIEAHVLSRAEQNELLGWTLAADVFLVRVARTPNEDLPFKTRLGLGPLGNFDVVADLDGQTLADLLVGPAEPRPTPKPVGLHEYPLCAITPGCDIEQMRKRRRDQAVRRWEAREEKRRARLTDDSRLAEKSKRLVALLARPAKRRADGLEQDFRLWKTNSRLRPLSLSLRVLVRTDFEGGWGCGRYDDVIVRLADGSDPRERVNALFATGPRGVNELRVMAGEPRSR